MAEDTSEKLTQQLFLKLQSSQTEVNKLREENKQLKAEVSFLCFVLKRGKFFFLLKICSWSSWEVFVLHVSLASSLGWITWVVPALENNTTDSEGK